MQLIHADIRGNVPRSRQLRKVTDVCVGDYLHLLGRSVVGWDVIQCLKPLAKFDKINARERSGSVGLVTLIRILSAGREVAKVCLLCVLGGSW